MEPNSRESSYRAVCPRALELESEKFRVQFSLPTYEFPRAQQTLGDHFIDKCQTYSKRIPTRSLPSPCNLLLLPEISQNNFQEHFPWVYLWYCFSQRFLFLLFSPATSDLKLQKSESSGDSRATAVTLE
jgi:hypothetical protein